MEMVLQADTWPCGPCSPVATLDPGIAPPTGSLPLSSGPRPGLPLTLGKAQLLRGSLVTPEDLDRALVLRCGGPSARGLSRPRPPPQTWSWGTFIARPSDAPKITHEAGRARLQEMHLGAGNPHQLRVSRSRPASAAEARCVFSSGGADSQKTGFSRVHTELQGSVHSRLHLWTKRWGGPRQPRGRQGERGGTGWGAWRGPGEPGVGWGLPEASRGWARRA